MQEQVWKIRGRTEGQTWNWAIAGDGESCSPMKDSRGQVFKLFGPPSIAPMSLVNCPVMALTDPNTRSVGLS
jgi:hypothetical protein